MRTQNMPWFFTRILTAVGMTVVFTSCSKIEYQDCFEIGKQEGLIVRLVDDALEPDGTYMVSSPASMLPAGNVPSCNGFDGIHVDEAYVLSNIGLASRVPSHTCSLPLADIDVPGIGTFVTARGQEAEQTYTNRGNGGIEVGITTVAPSVTIGGCTGQWIFATFPYGIALKYTDRHDDAWATDYLFDQLEPGDYAPILVIRYFQVEQGSACPALPSGASQCADIFSGYFERVP